MTLHKKILTGSISALVIFSMTLPTFADTQKKESLNRGSSINIVDPSEDLIVSDVLTYDELVSQIAKDKEISVKEAKVIVGNEPITRAKDGSLVRSTYRTLSTYVKVNDKYEPRISWYCQTNESGGFRAILKILDTSLIRSYNGMSKQFDGKIYTNLETPNRIFFRINGDFYNNGTTTASGGGQIGVGQSNNLNFTLSYASSHYAYVYKEGRKTF